MSKRIAEDRGVSLIELAGDQDRASFRRVVLRWACDSRRRVRWMQIQTAGGRQWVRCLSEADAEAFKASRQLNRMQDDRG